MQVIPNVLLFLKRLYRTSGMLRLFSTQIFQIFICCVSTFLRELIAQWFYLNAIWPLSQIHFNLLFPNLFSVPILWDHLLSLFGPINLWLERMTLHSTNHLILLFQSLLHPFKFILLGTTDWHTRGLKTPGLRIQVWTLSRYFWKSITSHKMTTRLILLLFHLILKLLELGLRC